MKLFALAAGSLAALALAGVAGAQSTASSPTQLRAYLAQMHPLEAKMVHAENRLDDTQLALLNGSGSVADMHAAARDFPRELSEVYAGMKAIQPPIELRGPHAGFVLTVKAEWKEKQTGDQPARSKMMEGLRAQWQEETTAQLRYAGVSVPVWVKTVHWNF